MTWSTRNPRNRLTVAFRIILAIPHLIVSQVWGYLAQILSVVQWFIILFTGKRNEGIWNLQQSWLGYYARVVGYVDLLFDQYPAFGTDAGAVPVQSHDLVRGAGEPTDERDCDFIWIIPAAIVGVIMGLIGAVVLLVSWFAIIITGKQSRGWWDFILKVARYTFQLQSYGLLMTDTYPKWGEGAMAATRHRLDTAASATRLIPSTSIGRLSSPTPHTADRRACSVVCTARPAARSIRRTRLKYSVTISAPSFVVVGQPAADGLRRKAAVGERAHHHSAGDEDASCLGEHRDWLHQVVDRDATRDRVESSIVERQRRGCVEVVDDVVGRRRLAASSCSFIPSATSSRGGERKCEIQLDIRSNTRPSRPRCSYSAPTVAIARSSMWVTNRSNS